MAIYLSKGTISAMSEVQSGVSESGYHWQNMTLVLEIPAFQGATSKQVFRVSGDTIEDVMQYKVGDKVEVSWSMYAREWNGKMYNNVDLVKISGVTSATKETPREVPTPKSNKKESLDPAEVNDLPF